MKSCIVVGGGIAGLSAGVYAAASGYRTVVVERHEVPGGVCASWDRGPYVFDICLHWLMGTAPGDSMRQLYDEVGALDQVELVPTTTFARLVDARSGLELRLTPDLDDLLAQVRAISPEDVPHFREVVEAALPLRELDLSPARDPGAAGALRQAWSMRAFPLLFARWGLSTAQWALRLRHPTLRTLMAGFGEGAMPMALFLVQLGQLAGGHLSQVRSRSGFVPGPSRAFAAGIAARLVAQGGVLRLGAEVEAILVEGDRAVGVRLADGEELRADHVISTAPLHTTVYRLLGGRHVDAALETRFARWKLFPPLVMVHFGCDRTWDVPTGSASLRNLPGFRCLGRRVDALSFRSMDFDPLLAPPGHTVVEAGFSADYDAWTELHHTPRAYQRAKEQVVADVTGALESWLPGLRDHVHLKDVSTPYTFWRFTRAWRGSYEGWWPSGEAMRTSFDRQLPGLANLWLSGQWLTAGGGIPPAVADGREVVHRICAQDGGQLGTPRAPAPPTADAHPATTPAEIAEGAVGALLMLGTLVTPMLQGTRSHWGLDADAAAAAWPGDEAVPTPRWMWTHAVTVEAPAGVTWAWVAQLGQGRGGFYSYEALENLAGCTIDNAAILVPGLRPLRLGDDFRLHPEMPAMKVTQLHEGQFLVVSGRLDLASGEGLAADAELPPDAFAVSWAFVVEPLGDDACRVVSRFRTSYPDTLANRLTYGPAVLEPIGFVMDRRMLLGIKARAEGTWPGPAT